MKILNNRLLLLLSITFLQLAMYGQTNAPNIIPPSPKSENFLRFGNVPVNYNTGVPDISIPLYTVKCGKLEVPIILRYHIGSVRPGIDPSDIGLGWVLDVGGQISRTIMGKPDDIYPTPPTKRSSSQLNQSSQTDIQYLIDCNGQRYDTEYDLFDYSISSQNGKFLIDKSSGSYQAHLFSFRPLKFDFTLLPQSSNPSGSYLSIIKATETNGNTYTFGDDAVENCISVGSPYGITSWMLKKIIDANQVNEINFMYNTIPQYMSSKTYTQGGIYGDNVKEFSMRTSGSGYDLVPNIKCANQSAYATYSCITIKQITFNNGKVVFDLSNNNQSIDGFTVFDSQNRIIKKIVFNKSDFGAYNHKKLNEVRIYDNNQTQYQSYQLNYTDRVMNSNARIGTDYWGYYNNTIDGCTEREYSYFDCSRYLFPQIKRETLFSGDKSPNAFETQAEVLKKIIYPTKGETEFLYEGNTYSRIGNGVGNVEYPGGGLRVQSVIDRSATGNENKRSFLYEGGGIDFSLDNPINYTTTTYSVLPVPAGENYYICRNRDFSNTLLPDLGDNHVKYTKVTEINGDFYSNSGKTIYYYQYSNPNNDGIFHMNISDDIGRTILHDRRDWDNGLLYQKDVYKQDPIGVYKKVLSEKNEYNQQIDETFPNLKIFRTIQLPGSDALSQWQTVRNMRGSLGESVSPDYTLFGCYDYYISAGRTKLTKKTTVNYFYNQNQVDSVASYSTYSYDNPSHNFVTKEETKTSKGDGLITEYKYPYNFNSAGNIYQTMIDKNILSPIIEQINSKYSNNTTTFIQSTKNNYSYFQGNTIIAPAYVETKTGTNNYESRLNYNAYDKKGNLTDVSKTGDIHTVYLWSYNYQYPVAKIEGISYTDFVNSYYSQNNVDALAQTAVPNKSQIDGIRMALNGAYPLISTYTYAPLVGLVTATDPLGVTTNYTYDTFNRLYLARNDDKNVIARYRYGYQNTPDNGQGGYTTPTATLTPGASSYTSGATGTASLSGISGGTGSYTYSWYLKDSSGNTLWSSLNTTTTSISYPCSQTGTLTVQCVITDNGTGISGTVSVNITVTASTTYSCGFTLQSGYNNITSNISCDNFTTSYYLVFYPTIPMQPYTPYFVANICSNCRPSANRTQTVTTGGRTWSITIYSNGNMYFTITSGSALSSGSGVGFGTWSFSK